MSDTAVEKRIMSPHNTNTERKDSAYKRSNKPFMEKKRRARINNCLTQLKTLVLQAMRKDTNQYSKLEKADILEMTVKHLRQLQRQQVSQAISRDPTVVTKYKTGFNECANEVMRYLGSVQGVEGDVRARLMNHLGNLVTQVNASTPEPGQQPLNVQIPQQQQAQAINQHGQIVQNGCLLMPANVHSSPLVLQPVQQVQSINTSNVYTQSTQQRSQTITSPVQQFCGSFQIVHTPNASPVSAVAVPVYLGQQSQTLQPSMQQTTQSPASTCSTSPMTSSYTRSPPRTKASLKAYDTSAFTQVSSADIHYTHSNNSSPSCSPTSQEMSSFSSQMDLTLNGLAVKCGRTPSPLKADDVWRPW